MSLSTKRRFYICLIASFFFLLILGVLKLLSGASQGKVVPVRTAEEAVARAEDFMSSAGPWNIRSKYCTIAAGYHQTDYGWGVGFMTKHRPDGPDTVCGLVMVKRNGNCLFMYEPPIGLSYFDHRLKGAR